MAVKWTDDQQKVIEARGSNLLVSAAAGSGKTAVLVERMIQRILYDEKPLDIDRLLVVTFTRAAAAEMRERVTAAIEKRCAAEPENERLQRQQALVHNAQITTIDSFCAFVVRNHFGDIGIEPNFRVADTGELELLQQDVVRDVFEACYREADVVLSAGADNRLQAGPGAVQPAGVDGEPQAVVSEEHQVAADIDNASDIEIKADNKNENNNAVKMNYSTAKDFLRLVDAYSGSRNDAAVRDMVMSICRMSDSTPWPKEWVAGLANAYQAESAEAFEQTEFMQEIVAFALLQLQEAADSLTGLLQSAQETEGLENYAKTLENDVTILEEVCRKTKLHLSYESLYESLRSLNLGSMAKVMKFKGDANRKKYILDERNRIKKEVEALRDRYFSFSLEELYEQTQRIRPMAEQLVALSLRCLDAFAEEKRQKRIVSFADMEHFALNILVDEQTKELRPAAQEFQDRFVEIMVDEYQDSNQVQEEILNAISRESRGEHNRFMVGDIKQSIYRFRQARPEIFMEKYRTFETADTAADRRITLSRNFRSRPQVLDFVNDIFVKIMQPDLGNVAYDKEAMLYKGADYPAAGGMEAEVLLYDSAAEEQKEQIQSEQGAKTDTVARKDVAQAASQRILTSETWPQKLASDATARSLISTEESPARMEIHMIAQRIRQLMDSLKVRDASGQLRPLRYGDIAILMRGVKSSESDLLEILSDAGIPVQLDSSTGYFSSQEVRVMLAFLQILDNPLQDIPLAAVLRSPIAGLGDEQLAQIRIREDETKEAAGISSESDSQSEAMPDAVMETAAETEVVTDALAATAEKKKPHSRSFSEAAWDYLEHAPEGSIGAQFYDLYCRMRSLVQDTPIHELIGRILQETGYRDYVCMLPAGHKRAANLDMLVEKAADYEQTSYKGLFHFIRYIEKLHQYKVDFGEAQEGSVQEDAVSVMTIHKSKGLEFPVVFVAGIGRKLNQQDSRQKLLLHADLGIGLNEIQLSPKRKIESLVRLGIADRITRENLGEELRILYVAMTRAKEKLILTGTVKDYDAIIQKCIGNVRENHPISFSQRFRAGSYLDWILPAMQSYPGKYDAQVYSGADLIKEEETLAKKADRSAAKPDGKQIVYETGNNSLYSDEVQINCEIDEKRLKSEALGIINNTGGNSTETGINGIEKVGRFALEEQIRGVSDADVERIRRELSYVYPYAHEAGRKSKYSVSELKHHSMLENYDREQNEAEIPEFLKEEKEPCVPQFIRRRDAAKADQPDENQEAAENKVLVKNRDVSRGALRGTAVHRVMECLDFRKLAQTLRLKEKLPVKDADAFIQKENLSVNNADIFGTKEILSENFAASFAKEELSRIKDAGLLSPEYAALVSSSMLSTFLQDPVALRMADAASRGELFREKPFVMDKDGVLIQGIIDVFWMEKDRIVLLDYKTDAVTTAEELIARYQTQLELYAEALSRLFCTEGEIHRKIECMMYSFRLRRCILL